MKKIFALLMLATIVSNCSGYSTHGQFITEHKDAWMNGYVTGEDGKEVDREDDADKGLVFCRANPSEDGSAAPVCYRTRFE